LIGFGTLSDILKRLVWNNECVCWNETLGCYINM